MVQLTLWSLDNQYEPFNRQDLPRPHYPCPGCGAKAGEWVQSGRFRWLTGTVGVCDECASIPEVVLEIAKQERPPDNEACPFPAGSDGKIEWMQRRLRRGLDLFHQADNPEVLPPRPQVGPPDTQGADGETGVERCGDRYRVRPFYRGRKWFWGLYDTEEEAIAAARSFWKLFSHDKRPKPALWLPCAKDDAEFGAVAIEFEHFTEWRWRYPGVNARQVARRYRAALKAVRIKPTADEVFLELHRRLREAAGNFLFDGYDWDSGEYVVPNGGYDDGTPSSFKGGGEFGNERYDREPTVVCG